MPTLDFTLPHWAYWVGLIIFPLVAMVLARRGRAVERRYSLTLGYLIWATGGLIGLHRFYLRNLLGFVYLPIFLVILVSNSQGTTARSILSDVNNEVRVAERSLAREEQRLESDLAALPELRAELDAADPESFSRRAIELRIDRAERNVETSRERIAENETLLTESRPRAEQAAADRAYWNSVGKYALWVILALMLIDAVLLPGLVRRANAAVADEPGPDHDLSSAAPGEDVTDDRALATNWIDRLSLFAGEFVAYWAVIAVFVYYYEVIARYVFNSPTNWAHEAMYLMFGMQYLIAGAYAMLTESHVRVDIFYAPLHRRNKAWVDLATSVFFFIFAGTLLYTSYTFAMDAIAVPSGNAVVSDWARGEIGLGDMLGGFDTAQWTNPGIRWGEISLSEWEVPLWPMKWVMVVGGLLLVLQGISKVSKDIRAIARGE
ncbi:TRAP-type mannitol/chloroaromatic compound transport system permease small subunit [Palleronia aestuarii]|uniref:TRAP transporter small permease protein n=1 Tax=Palleronia aestuarii TaxID=568105 RepID=A0A2W7N810_9RHOB|nr:TRAP transporter small permease subunit [Palleronia aestuarii]PZX15843.1 TRAP-type mannitol/chloroaromatic compound transport system permease small subunit [Palleronia aestuarii]